MDGTRRRGTGRGAEGQNDIEMDGIGRNGNLKERKVTKWNGGGRAKTEGARWNGETQDGTEGDQMERRGTKRNGET